MAAPFLCAKSNANQTQMHIVTPVYRYQFLQRSFAFTLANIHTYRATLDTGGQGVAGSNPVNPTRCFSRSDSE